MQYRFWPLECYNAILHQATSLHLSSQTMYLTLGHSATGASSGKQNTTLN